MLRVCQSFSVSPSVAWVELGHTPASDGRRALLTRAVMDAEAAERLEREQVSGKTEHWGAAEHTFYKELLDAAGYAQPDMRAGGGEN